MQFYFPRCNKSPSYRSSQGFMFMRMYVVFLGQYRIILSADTASEVRQMLSQKRR